VQTTWLFMLAPDAWPGKAVIALEAWGVAPNPSPENCPFFGLTSRSAVVHAGSGRIFEQFAQQRWRRCAALAQNDSISRAPTLIPQRPRRPFLMRGPGLNGRLACRRFLRVGRARGQQVRRTDSSTGPPKPIQNHKLPTFPAATMQGHARLRRLARPLSPAGSWHTVAPPCSACNGLPACWR